jgi:hypothetical protein
MLLRTIPGRVFTRATKFCTVATNICGSSVRNLLRVALPNPRILTWHRYVRLQTGRSRVRFPMVSLEFFQWHNPSGRTMALGSNQPLTEMSTGVFPGGKGGRCVRLTTLPTSCAVIMKSGNLNFRESSGPLQACNGTALPLPLPVCSEYSWTTDVIWNRKKIRKYRP